MNNKESYLAFPHMPTMEELALQMGELLGLNGFVDEDVLFSAIKKPGYFQDLYVSRDTEGFLKHLLNNPPYKTPGVKTLEGNRKNEFLEEAAILLREWKKNIFYQEEKKNYYAYLNKNQHKDAGEKPCKPCAEIKIDELKMVYLDHNATTYIRPEISEVLNKYYSGKLGFGNPSSNSTEGKFSSDLILDARIKIAYCLSATPEEIFLTGSGSEANNLAIKGIAFRDLDRKGHLITNKTEHSSVLKVMEYLETLGFAVTCLNVDEYGMVSPDSVRRAIRKDTILVSVMAANNEIGTINPIQEIGGICKENGIPFMVDAIQAFGKIPLDPKAMGISLLSFSGHKIYAPKGIGGLYVEKGVTLAPQIHGGGQEMGLRSGTENVGSIIALGEAAELAHNEMEKETERLLGLRNLFLAELEKVEPGFVVNGSLEQRVPNNLSIGFPHVDSGTLLHSLNRVGISASAGSACSSKQIKTSHVLNAIGADTENYATIRFGLGLRTTEEDILYLIKYLNRILPLLKAA